MRCPRSATGCRVRCRPLLEDDRVTLELILDGVHVSPAVARMLLTSAPRRVALITDAMAAAAHADGAYRLGELDVHVADGRALLDDGVTIAGSTLTLDRAVRAAIVDLGLAASDAVGAATAVPAAALGDPARGLLEPGMRADLVAWDADWRVRKVWLSPLRDAPLHELACDVHEAGRIFRPLLVELSHVDLAGVQ